MSGTIGRRVLRRDRVDSTMDEVLALAAAGEPDGTVVVADEQLAGRGRDGRPWIAPTGSSILCSVLLRPSSPPERLTTLPLLVGVAVAEAIEAVAPVKVQLKWPNDCWIDERKVAGVLIQARVLPTLAVAVGIGINVHREAGHEPGGTSIEAASGRAIDRDELLGALLDRLDREYRRFVEADGRPDLAPWRARAALVGEVVEVRDGSRRLRGVLTGVDWEGALLLRENDATIRVASGELVRGPVPVDVSRT